MLWIGVSDARAGVESCPPPIKNRAAPGWGRIGNRGPIVTFDSNDTCYTPSTFITAPTGDCAQRTNARKAKANKPASTNH